MASSLNMSALKAALATSGLTDEEQKRYEYIVEQTRTTAEDIQFYNDLTYNEKKAVITYFNQESKEKGGDFGVDEHSFMINVQAAKQSGTLKGGRRRRRPTRRSKKSRRRRSTRRRT
jgi:hypothetical protein